jgi:hypothetical protein
MLEAEIAAATDDHAVLVRTEAMTPIEAGLIDRLVADLADPRLGSGLRLTFVHEYTIGPPGSVVNIHSRAATRYFPGEDPGQREGFLLKQR